MTILDKLHIKGIRSYNPKKFQSIEFQNPLTLIVGQNGTGKTTIIESLKYATTNILPPNTKGGAFIYDNNLANDAEVKAEIKLSIVDMHNRNITIQKILQSSLKKNKTENKTIELNIFVNDNKLEKSLNKSDLNKIFDLNISILNNVIFCHQDESMWCLSEPSVNKKIFDDIFSSAQYTKQLLDLKTCKKDILSKLKITQTELGFLIKQKEKKFNIEKKLTSCIEDLHHKKAKMSHMERNHNEMKQILENLHLECKKMSIIKNKKDEISKIKILKEIKFTENECNELLEKQDLNYLKKEITTLEKIISDENIQIKEINENKHKNEIFIKEKTDLINKKNNLVSFIADLELEIKKIKCWINEQQINFQNKLKLKDINMNNLNYKEVFDNFFSKYEIELRKKNNILENLRKNFEKLKNEFDENSKIITKYENIFLTNPEILYSDDIKLSMNDINNKIVDLEKKYDVCMKFNKDFILNEEKKNRKNDILKKLKNLNEKDELKLFNDNNLLIVKHKKNLKIYSEIKNKISIYFDMIKKKEILFNHDIYLTKEFNNYDIYLNEEICNKLLEMSIKNKKCILCKSEIYNLKIFKEEIYKLHDKKSENFLKTHEQNMKIFEEIKNIFDLFYNLSDSKFVKYKNIFNNFDKYKSRDIFSELNDFYRQVLEYYENLIVNEEMLIIGLEEEIECVKCNLLLFNELKDLNIKDMEKVDPDKIFNDIKIFKNYKEILEKKDKINIRENLKKTNEDLNINIENMQIEISKKTEKIKNFRDILLKKQTEVDFKLAEFIEKNNKLDSLKKHCIIISNKIDELSRMKVNFDEEKFKNLINNNQINRDNLNNLKEEHIKMKDIHNSLYEHTEHYKNIKKYNNIKNEILNFENSIKSLIKSNNENDIIKEYSMIINSKIDSVTEKMNLLLKNKNMLFGEIKQLNKNKENYELELKNEYDDVIQNYNKKFIEHIILEITIRDLDKCIKILDKSIIDYHYNKIEEINLFLTELWGNCYKGNDIDTFKLKINENGSKSYSYKLVVIKQGIELDMRNRCSAGQKMIGSILLRLALAHVFCINFNILTLDEPTTNLDKENIESLAYTLIEIIKKNQQLQLVIITHDEDFLNIMCREGIDCYFRIKRNENGDSIITKQII